MQEDFVRELSIRFLPQFEGRKNELIPILQLIQAKCGYVPEEAMSLIAGFLNVTRGQIHSVATFYSHFRLAPPGKRRVSVCRGTACHIRGAPQILEETQILLGIREGETTSDQEYTLESVACIGCCALAPCMRINKDVHGELTTGKVRRLLDSTAKAKSDVQ